MFQGVILEKTVLENFAKALKDIFITETFHSAVSGLKVSLYYRESIIRLSFLHIKQKINQKKSANHICISFVLKSNGRVRIVKCCWEV